MGILDGRKENGFRNFIRRIKGPIDSNPAYDTNKKHDIF